MAWAVVFDPAFVAEFRALPETVQDELLAHAAVLRELGPALGRPRVDTMKGSRHANMKDLRFGADGGVWRVAFAFDPQRRAVLLGAAAGVLPKAHRRGGRALRCLCEKAR
jgi:hypothetical protein